MSMELFVLASTLADHNRTQRGKAVLYGLLAIPLWFFSYWFTKFLLFFLLGWFGVARFVDIGTWAFMALLAFEGFRYGREIFDLEGMSRSFYTQGLTGSEGEENLRTAVALHYGVPDPFRAGKAIAEMMLAAPRSTLNCWRAMREVLHLDSSEVESAEAVFYELGELGEWAPLDDYLDRADELQALNRLKVVWSRIHEGEAQVRVTPSLKERYFGDLD